MIPDDPIPKPIRPSLADALPPGLEPRGLTKQQAAGYTGCATERAFEDRVRRGLYPGPMPGTTRYDRKALDVAMDRLSGLEAPPTAVAAEVVAVLADWRDRHGGPPATPKPRGKRRDTPKRRTTLTGVQTVRRERADGSVTVHYYHRATRAKLPGRPGSPEFRAALEAAESGTGAGAAQVGVTTADRPEDGEGA